MKREREREEGAVVKQDVKLHVCSAVRPGVCVCVCCCICMNFIAHQRSEQEKHDAASEASLTGCRSFVLVDVFYPSRSTFTRILSN